METENRSNVDRAHHIIANDTDLSRHRVHSEKIPSNGELEDPSHTDLMNAQYLNVHKVPDSLPGELLDHTVVDLEASDFSQQSVVGSQYYDDDLLAHDLTEDDRRLAAALVAVQLVQHQKSNQPTSLPTSQHQTVLSTDLLNAKSLSSISTIDKPAITAMVSSYMQAVEDENVHQLTLMEQSNNDRSLKLYQQVPITTESKLLPLPPLKKVLSSQSSLKSNKFVWAGHQVPENSNEVEHPVGMKMEIKEEVVSQLDAQDDYSSDNMSTCNNTSNNSCNNIENAINTSVMTIQSEEGQQMQMSDDLSGNLDEFDSDYDGESRPSRKSLPHKKRIPRKLKRATTVTPARTTHVKNLKRNKCGEQFTSQSALVVHRATNSNKKTFACELCTKPFTNQLKFFEHLKAHYEPLITISTNSSLSASPDDVAPTSLSEKVSNLPTINSEIIVTSTSSQAMDAGDASLSSEPDLKREMQETVDHNDYTSITESSHSELPSSDQMKLVKMNQVNPPTAKEESIVLTNVITTPPLACIECGKTFRRAKTLESHMQVHAKPDENEMEDFSEPEDMMEGIRHVVNMVQEVDEKSSSVRNWRNSEKLPSLSSNSSRSAARAEKNVVSADSTDNGMDLDLMDSPGEKKKTNKQLPCPQCPRTFNHRNSLMYHVRSHSGQRPHQCEVCGKSFFAASALKVHLRLHSGAKPYKCEFCERHFRQWGDLKYHVTSIHSDQKQFQCEYCGKDFARKYSLIVHRRIHTGEKNYVCEFCHKSFRASSYLQNHRRIHTGEKPHQCHICGKPFRVRSDMKRHTATHNKVLVASPQLQTNDVSQRINIIPNDHHTATIARVTDSGTITLTKIENDHSDNEFKDMKASQLLVRFEDESESTLPDGTACATPLNLNIRPHSDSDDGLAYSRDSLDRESSTLYVWIPAGADHLLPDE